MKDDRAGDGVVGRQGNWALLLIALLVSLGGGRSGPPQGPHSPAFSRSRSPGNRPDIAWAALGEAATVRQMAFSPDGLTFATGSDAGIRLWRVSDGRFLRALPGPVGGLTYSPDGKTLVSGGGNQVRIWRLSDGALVRELAGHPQRVSTVAVSPDGQTVASGCYQEIRLWRLADGELLRTLTGHEGYVNSVAFSPDGQTLASAGSLYDNFVRLWNVADGIQIRALPRRDWGVNSVAFSPDGETLASGAWGGQFDLWRVLDGANVWARTSSGGDINTIAFAPDGQSLATCQSGQIRIWSIADGSLQQDVPIESNTNAMSWSPDGQVLASGGWGWALRRASDGGLLQESAGHESITRSVAFSPDGRTVASGSDDQTAKLWHAADGTLVRTLLHPDAVRTVAFSPDNRWLATGGGGAKWPYDYGVRVWQVSDGTLLHTLEGHGSAVYSLAFSPDGQTLASGSADNTVKLWSPTSGSSLGILSGHTDGVTSLAFSPGGDVLASGSWDETIRLWRVSNGQLLATWTSDDNVNHLAFSPDGQWLAAAGSGRINLWRVADGALLRSLRGHQGAIASVAFSPNGLLLLSAGQDDNTLRVWRVADGELLLSYDEETTGPHEAVFSPDGGTFVYGLEDGSVLLARTPPFPNDPPSPPTLLAPSEGTVFHELPTFQLQATDPNGDALRFRLELSQDGFQTLAKVYDGVQSNQGWDKAAYTGGETATFTVPAADPLGPGSYQWRAAACDGWVWSAPSLSRSFTLELLQPLLLTLSPNVAANQGWVALRVGGLNLKSGLQVWLEKAGESNRPGSQVQVEGGRFVSARFNLEGVAEGRWDVVARDLDGQVGRLAEALTVTPPCDLTLDELQIEPAEDPADGQRVTASARLRNLGADAPGAIEVVFQGWGQEVSAWQRGGLAAGGEVVVSAPLMAKAGEGAPLRATVDPSNSLMESNKDNNQAEVALPQVPAPDLTITHLEFEPAQPRSGDTVRVSATVKNAGGRLLRPFFVNYLVDGERVATEPWYAPLGGGESVQVSIHFPARAGMAALKAQADPGNQIAEGDESNNEASLDLPPIAKPDLQALALEANPPLPGGGSWTTLTLRLRNQGPGTQGGGFNVRFLVDGTPLATTFHPYALPAGEEIAVRAGARWRAQAGSHTLKAVVDPEDEVAEAEEVNNQAQLPLTIEPADLTVARVDLEPPELIAGAAVLVKALVRNRGAGGAGPCLVALFEEQRFANSRWLSGVAAGASAVVELPWRARAGVGTLRVAADVNDTVAESDETNNQEEADLAALQPPDFMIQEVTLTPPTPVQGEEVVVQARVANVGAPFVGQLDVRLGWEGTWRRAVVTLDESHPGATAEATIQLPVRQAPLALETVTAVADPTNLFTESDETNNTRSLATGLQLVPPDLAVTAIEPRPAEQPVVAGTVVPVAVTVRNLGAPCLGAFTLALKVDGRSVGSVPFGWGAQDTQKEVMLSWPATPGRRYRFAAEIALDDAADGNDRLEQSVALEVLGPDLEVTKLAFEPQAGVKLNDLVTFRTTVRNRGPGSVASQVSVYLHVSGKPAQEATQLIPGLRPGEERELVFTWVASEQAKPRAVAIADSRSEIQENDETNNARAVDLPFDVAREEAFQVVLEPAAQVCPRQVATTFRAQVRSWITVPTVFDLTVEGLPDGWGTLAANEVYLQAGEWQEVTLAVMPPADAPEGGQAFQVRATRRGMGDTRSAEGSAQVAPATAILELLPEDGQTLPSDSVTFTWRTGVEASSEVFLKQEGEADYRRIAGSPGTFHQVTAEGLGAGRTYSFYVRSVANGSESASAPRALKVGRGVSFSQRRYAFQVQRDWMQTVGLSVRNLSDQPLAAVASVENPYDPEIVVGFAGSGSVDEQLELAPGETKELTLVIHAATAARAAYDLSVKVSSGPEGSPLVDVASVQVRVPLQAELELQELGTDPVTLVKRFQLINKGEVPVADVRLELDEGLQGRAELRPQMQMRRLEPQEAVEFELAPLFELAAHRDPAFAARLGPGRAVKVETPETQALHRQAQAGTVRAVSGAGSVELSTSYTLGDRDIYAVELYNRRIESKAQVDVCTNVENAVIDTPVPPIEEENIGDPYLIVDLEPRSPHGWPVAPHDIFFRVNGYPVGAIINEVPNRAYLYDVPVSVLNLSPVHSTVQQVGIETKLYNPAHYWRVGQVSLHLLMNEMVVYVPATSPEEALRTAHNLPYFAAHNDQDMQKLLDSLRAPVAKRTALWNTYNTASTHPLTVWPFIQSVFAGATAMFQHGSLSSGSVGWYNNMMTAVDKGYLNYNCSCCTGFVLDQCRQYVQDQFVSQGKESPLRFAVCQSGSGDNLHVFPVVWLAGTDPLETGQIIDIWPKQDWGTWSLKDALGGKLPLYRQFTPQMPPVRDFSYSDDAGNDYDFSLFKESQQELWDWWQHRSGGRSEVNAEVAGRRSRQAVEAGGALSVTAFGDVHLLVSDQAGNRSGFLPGGQEVNELARTRVLPDNGSQSPVPLTEVEVGAAGSRSYQISVASAGATSTTLALSWVDASGTPQAAAYYDVPLGGSSRQEGGIALSLDLEQPAPPLELADGRTIYPETAPAGEAAALQGETARRVLPAGLSMVSLPNGTQGLDPAAVLDAASDELRLARWNPEAAGESRYVFYPDTFAAALEPGRGYWVKLPRSTPVELVARGGEQAFSVPLQPGWNQIGNPFTQALAWDVQAIRVRRQGQELTLAQAAQAGWVDDYAWGWDGLAGAYALIYDGSLLPGVQQTLEPWAGYWIRARQACELVLPVPSSQRSAFSVQLSVFSPQHGEAVGAHQGMVPGWQVRLQAEAAGETAEVVVGAGRSRGLQAGVPPAPPEGAAGLQVVSLREGQPLAVDVRRGSGRQVWEVVVDQPSPQPTHLSWPDLRGLPAEVSLTLVDTVTGARRYLRTTRGYTFEPAAGETSRRFRLLAEPGREGGLQISNLRATATRGGTMEVRFSLSRAASTTVRVLRLTGQTVSDLEQRHPRQATEQVLRRDGQGRKLPAGVYLLEVTAEDEEGRQVKAVTTVAVR